ncbi:MAG TPA: hypothetical protein VHA70_08845 [Bauldia sp.]|nr:hypothetical protein [Bauldia sp.]
MKPIRMLIAALAFAGLAGCYSSDKPLVGDADSVAEYSKVTFLGKEADAKPAAFTREGKHYMTDSEGQKVLLHLKRVDGDYYVAQLTGPDDAGGPSMLYGYLHFDVPNKKAEAWRTFGTKDDVQAGMHMCKDAVCIDDLDAYIAYGKKAVDDNLPPDTIFTLTVEQ